MIFSNHFAHQFGTYLQSCQFFQLSESEHNRVLEIIVNDKPTQVPNPCTIAELLKLLEITSPAVAVELNLEIQPHHEFANRKLKQGDSLEIVTLVGGG